MAQELEFIITADKSDLERKLKESRKLARDTKKELDQDTLVKLELDFATFQRGLKEAKKELKIFEKEGDKTAIIKAQLNVNELSRARTEAGRLLNNFVNKGDAELSRFREPFERIINEIKTTREEMLKMGKSTKGFDELIAKADKLDIELKNGTITQKQYAREMGVLSKQAQNVGQSFGGLKNILISLAGVGLLSTFKSWASGVISLGSGLEQATVSFTTMLGSAEKADKLLKDLTSFAQKTPFELTGIRQTAKQLLAFGFNAEELIPTLKSLGDVASGLSVPIEQVAYAYGQVRTANQLYGTELRQFMNAGVPLLAELADMFGKTEVEVKKMVETGKVGFDDVEKAFIRMSSEGGKFYNLMEAQSATLAGKWSNFKDVLAKLAEDMAGVFIPVLSGVLGKIVEMMEKFPILTKAIGFFSLGLLGLSGVLTLLLPIILASSVGFGALAASLLPITGIITGIAVAVAGLSYLWGVYSNDTEELKNKLDELEKKEKTLTEKQKDLNQAFREGKITAKEYKDKIGEIEKAKKELRGEIEKTSEQLKNEQSSWANFFRFVINSAISFFSGIKNIFGLLIGVVRATGGGVVDIMVGSFNFLLLNIDILGKNMLIAFSNIVRNLGIYLKEGFVNAATGAMNGMISVIESGINFATKGLNKLPGVDIGETKLNRLSDPFGPQAPYKLINDGFLEFRKMGDKIEKETESWDYVGKLGFSKKDGQENAENFFDFKFAESGINQIKKNWEDLSNTIKGTGGEIKKINKELKNDEVFGPEVPILGETGGDGDGDGTGGTGGTEKVQTELEKQKELLKQMADLREQDIMNSELSETEKAEKILESREQLKKDLESLEKDDFENRSDWAKKILEIAKEHQKELEKLEAEKNAGFRKNIEDQNLLLKENEKIFTDVIEEQKKSVEGLKTEIENLNKEIEKTVKELENLDKLENTKTSDLANRNVKILEEETRIKEELNKLERENVDISLAKSIGESTLKTLGTGDISGNKVEDLLKAVQLENELLKLQKEKEIIFANTTEEQREQAKIQNELSPTEKILAEYEARKLLLSQTQEIDKLALQSKLENQKLELEGLELLKENELLLLEDLQNKKLELEKEIQKEIEDIEKQITDIKQAELNKQKQMIEDYKNSVIPIFNEIKQARLDAGVGAIGGVGGVSNSKTVNMGGVNINNNVDLELLKQDLVKNL